MQRLKQGTSPYLAKLLSLVGGRPTDIVLNRIQSCDPFQSFSSQRRGVGLFEVIIAFHNFLTLILSPLRPPLMSLVDYRIGQPNRAHASHRFWILFSQCRSLAQVVLEINSVYEKCGSRCRRPETAVKIIG